jgi:F-type H+-transporting ATPase subunit delta
MNISIIAQRYATALWNVTESGERGSSYSVLSELGSALWGSDEAKRLLLNPSVSSEVKKSIVNECLDKLSAKDPLKPFFNELISKGRLDVFDQVVAAFEQKLMASNNRKKAKVTTAIPLQEADSKRVQAELEKKVGSSVTLDSVVDPQILGGMIIEVDGKLLDLSVKTKLNAFQTHLVSE